MFVEASIDVTILNVYIASTLFWETSRKEQVGSAWVGLQGVFTEEYTTAVPAVTAAPLIASDVSTWPVIAQ